MLYEKVTENMSMLEITNMATVRKSVVLSAAFIIAGICGSTTRNYAHKLTTNRITINLCSLLSSV
jgi:hypothetical protein